MMMEIIKNELKSARHRADIAKVAYQQHEDYHEQVRTLYALWLDYKGPIDQPTEAGFKAFVAESRPDLSELLEVLLLW